MTIRRRFAWALLAPAAALAAPERDLAELSLEELSDIEVTSVSRTEEPLADAAAAVTVVTNEDLRRSGATTIPEALRLVPGLHVAQLNSNLWAVSARGFSSSLSSKLLVLSDTRSVYTPFFSGVLWDVQDFLLEDVDRIEVVRGPGGSLWGANAVNGVINITTRSAKDTQGAYFEGGGGNVERGFGAVRYGGQLAEGAWFRVFAKGFDRTGQFNPDGPANDGWKLGHFGFRADWQPDAKNTLTLQGDIYAGDIGQNLSIVQVSGRAGPTGKLVANVAGGNVLARWTRTLGEGSDLIVRAYYDGTHRDDPAFLDNLDTVNVDLQHRFRLPLNQELLWGLEISSMNNRNRGKGLLELAPADSRDNLFSGFVQDQIAVLPSLKLTLGTKLEHNDFSGFEYQPSARIAWNPFAGQLLWSAVSRAVRVPTRLERDVDVTVTSPGETPVEKLLGNRAYGSEQLLAWELGYRWHIQRTLFIDLAVYYNVYHGLDSIEFDPSFVDPRTGQTVVPIVNKNLTDGVTKGGEASLSFMPFRSWRAVANYTWTVVTVDPKGDDLNGGRFFAGFTPRHQIELQSFLDLPGRFQIDAFVRYATSLGYPRSVDPSGSFGVPAYTAVDLRLSWVWSRIDFSLVGRNLFEAHHREFAGGSEMKRAAYVKVAGRF